MQIQDGAAHVRKPNVRVKVHVAGKENVCFAKRNPQSGDRGGGGVA